MTKKVKSGYIILAILVVIAIAATVHSLITTKESVTINFDSNVEYNTNPSQKLSSKGNIRSPGCQRPGGRENKETSVDCNSYGVNPNPTRSDIFAKNLQCKSRANNACFVDAF